MPNFHYFEPSNIYDFFLTKEASLHKDCFKFFPLTLSLKCMVSKNMVHKFRIVLIDFECLENDHIMCWCMHSHHSHT